MGRAFRVFRALVLVGGLLAFGFLVHRLGWAGITRVLGETGLWFVVVAAIDVGSALCDGAAIHRLARVHGPLPYRRAVAAQLGGVAINRLTPGNALGEPIKVSIIVEHVPRDGAVAAIMMFDVAATCIAVCVIVIGVPLTLLVADLPARLALVAWIGAGVLLAFGVALVLLVRRGVLGTSIGMLARLRMISAERAVAWTTATRVIDTNIADLGKPRSRVAFAFLFGSRALHWAGTVVLLHASGLPLTAPLVIGMLSVGLLVQWASQIVPLGLGLADGGNYLLYAALGAPAAAGLDFSMVNRARTCVIAGIGLTVLAITSYVDRRRRARQE